MKDRMTTREFIRRFNAGEFNTRDVQVQCEAGWYDWFCKSTSLMNKTIRMGNIIRQIVDGGKVDLDKTYVFFKNNCPCAGNLYDDFRICDIETGDVLINVNIDNPYDQRYAVYGRFPEGEFWDLPYAEFCNSRSLVRWLNDPSYPPNDAVLLKRRIKREFKDADKRIDDYSIRLEDLCLSDDNVVAKLKITRSSKIADELIAALESIEGYDVNKQIQLDYYNWQSITLTFKKK